MVRKRVKADDVARIVDPIVQALAGLGRQFAALTERFDHLTERFDHLSERVEAGFEVVNSRLERVEQNTADTADAVRRIERSAIGGRAVALEERVSRIEKRLGLEPSG